MFHHKIYFPLRLVLFIFLLTSCEKNEEQSLSKVTPGSLNLPSSMLSILLFSAETEKDLAGSLKSYYLLRSQPKIVPSIKVNINSLAVSLIPKGPKPDPYEYIAHNAFTSQQFLNDLSNSMTNQDVLSKALLALVAKFQEMNDEAKSLVMKKIEPFLPALEASHAHDMFIAGMAAYNKLCSRAKNNPAFLKNFTTATVEQRISLITTVLESPSRTMLDSDQEALSCIMFMNAVSKFSHMKNLLQSTKTNNLFEPIETLAITNHKLYKTPQDYMDSNARLSFFLSCVFDAMKNTNALSEEECSRLKNFFEDAIRKLKLNATRSFNTMQLRKNALLKAQMNIMPFALLPQSSYINSSFAKKVNSSFAHWIDEVLVTELLKLCPGHNSNVIVCFDSLFAPLAFPLTNTKPLPTLTLQVT